MHLLCMETYYPISANALVTGPRNAASAAEISNVPSGVGSVSPGPAKIDHGLLLRSLCRLPFWGPVRLDPPLTGGDEGVRPSLIWPAHFDIDPAHCWQLLELDM